MMGVLYVFLVVVGISGIFPQIVLSVCPHQQPGFQRWSTINSLPQPGNSNSQDSLKVVIDTKIILDISPPKLRSVLIGQTGVLVVSPEGGKKTIFTDFIHIKGRMDVGSVDCKFDGRLEIILTGTRGKYSVAGFGEKFIGVDKGGTLEIHGKQKLSWTKLSKTIPKRASSPTIDVIDDVDSWEIGDRVFFTSTDYNMDQAERATIVQCDTCTAKQFKVDLTFKYMHFGEIEQRVDMRGEVGLLTRNIKVRGETQKDCPAANGNCGTCPKDWARRNCGKYTYDTFGGHIKFLKGFKDVHIEGLELENMGQQTSLGNYPLHFHMCENVGNNTSPPYLKDNSIHDSFARCITIHGTDGVLVQDNVALDILGHCYFLEDGGEKHNVFDGNLGAVIKRSLLTPSDNTPTVFWMTNPLVTLVNNVAAGSEHAGIWFIFPKSPIGPSAGQGFMSHASQTPITKVDNNVAHSSFFVGFNIDDVLNPDASVKPGDNSYDPKETPGDKNSKSKKVYIEKLTAYKNRFQNIWIRAGFIHVDRASLADAVTSCTMIRVKEKESYFTNGIFIGESAKNMGEPSVKWQFKNGGWKRTVFPRSLPLDWDEKWPRQGYIVYVGPIYAENVWFNNFKHSSHYKMGAIAFQKENHALSSAVSSIKGAQFGFDDSPTTGNRVFDGDETDYKFSNFDGDKGATLRWLDINQTIVKPFPVYLTNQCSIRNSWKMAICPHKYAKINLWNIQMGPGEIVPDMEIRRDDIPESKLDITEKLFKQFMIITGMSHSYSVSWKTTMPKSFHLIGSGVERSSPARIAICMPRNAKFKLWSYTTHKWTKVNSVTAVDNSQTGEHYFYDADIGILFVKLIAKSDRTANTVTECEGWCPMVRITVTSGDRNKANCHTAMYPQYKRQPPQLDLSFASMTTLPSVIPKTKLDPDLSLGAGSTRPFESRSTVIPVDGGLSLWTQWSICSETCGGGIRNRSRSCTNPRPAKGGKPCKGPLTENEKCNMQICPVSVSITPPTSDVPVTTSPTGSPTSEVRIAFSVYLTSMFTTQSPNRAVVFDNVLTNSLNAYDKSSGIYIVQRSGMYVFDWVVPSNVPLELLVNSKVVALTARGGMVVVHVTEGDNVYLRTQNAGVQVESSQSGRATFSGWRL